MRRVLLLWAAVVLPALCQVRYLDATKLWVLETDRTSYILGINEREEIQHVYWGKRLLRDQDLAPARGTASFAFESREGMTPEEYPGWGGMRYAEPCLKATFADGVRDLALKYVSHEVRGNELSVRLKDIGYDLFVTLHYRVWPASDILSRHAVVENRTKGNVVLESAASGVWHVPAGEGYRLSHLAGRWGAETLLFREPVQPGKKILESRRGNTSHQANPWFALDRDASEERGDVWFGALGWSGNWKFAVEQTPNRQVRLTGGYNDFDFAYLLEPGESVNTPPFYGGFTDGGFGESSRILHRFQLKEILPDRAAPRPRPVLYNSWYATTFNVNEPDQKALAEKAAKLGTELFVIDDGWFGQRDNDRAGLGDWHVNPKKFPNGLGPLIAHVEKLGMKFGLWVEPEMVNPDSDLYRAHPDWVIHFPGRPRTPGRHQLILNLARDDVKEHLFRVLDKLLSENRIAFVKWDMNRHFSEPGWPDAPVAAQKRIWVRYVENLYELIDRLRAKHPGVEIESCSGGGGRVDLGILKRADQVWTSDNTEALDRLRMQEGFGFAYPAKVMVNWVIDAPDFNNRTTPLKYRFLVAMTGALGLGGNLNKWPEQDMKLASEMVAYYKRIRGAVQHGDLYRLASPREGELSALQYVSADGRQAVLFAFLRHQQFGYHQPAIRLRGLDERAVYRLHTIDNKLHREDGDGQRLVPDAPRAGAAAGRRFRQHLGKARAHRVAMEIAAAVSRRLRRSPGRRQAKGPAAITPALLRGGSRRKPAVCGACRGTAAFWGTGSPPLPGCAARAGRGARARARTSSRFP
jgi:alpha-galactosidase